MKILKLSLAAVVAAGALSSLSAAPLEDAIKGIDVSGFGRYRYNTDHTRFKNSNTPNDSSAHHRFLLDVNFKTTLDDNFFTFIGLRYETIDISGSGANKGISNTHGGLSGVNGSWGGVSNRGDGLSGDSLSVRQYYVGFTGIPDTTIIAGRQVIGAFFTDDAAGTGIKVLNNSIEGLTLAGVVFDNVEDDEDIPNIPMYDITDRNGIRSINPNGEGWHWQNNVYGLSAIADYGWFFGQAWYGFLQNAGHLWALDADVKYAITDDFSVRARVNVGGVAFTKSMMRNNKNILENRGLGRADQESFLSKSTIVAVDLGATYDMFSVDAGFISYGKKNKTGAYTLDDAGKYIKPGEMLIDYTGVHAKHTVWFAKAGINYDAYFAGFDYVHDSVKGDRSKGNTDLKINEYVLRAAYKYNDKLRFDGYYSWLREKNSDTKEKRNKDRFRIQASYSF